MSKTFRSTNTALKFSTRNSNTTIDLRLVREAVLSDDLSTLEGSGVTLVELGLTPASGASTPMGSVALSLTEARRLYDALGQALAPLAGDPA